MLFYVTVWTDQGSGAVPAEAENATEAGNKVQDMFPYEEVTLIETEAEHNTRCNPA